MKFYVLLFLLLIPLLSHSIECPNGQYVVNEHPRTAYYRNDGTYVSEAHVSSYCKNYRSDGPTEMNFWARIPKGWPFKKEVFKKCTKLEQKNIQKALSELPKILTQTGKIKILCSKKSTVINNPATSSPEGKIIVFYELAFSMNLKRILTHEMAHFLYESLSVEEKKNYWNISEWYLSKEDGLPKTNRRTFSAPDGQNDPDEDFANNVESFYFEPQIMKKDFSEINKWLFNFLGGEK